VPYDHVQASRLIFFPRSPSFLVSHRWFYAPRFCTRVMSVISACFDIFHNLFFFVSVLSALSSYSQPYVSLIPSGRSLLPFPVASKVDYVLNGRSPLPAVCFPHRRSFFLAMVCLPQGHPSFSLTFLRYGFVALPD